MDEVLNTVVQEGIIEKNIKKDLRLLRASYMDKGVGKGKKTVQAEGSAVKTWGGLDLFKVTLLDIKADSVEKISPPSGRVEPLSISGQTILCWMDQASLFNQSERISLWTRDQRSLSVKPVSSNTS